VTPKAAKPVDPTVDLFTILLIISGCLPVTTGKSIRGCRSAFRNFRQSPIFEDRKHAALCDRLIGFDQQKKTEQAV
jgi:hypothetical protein